ncbi:hypothetical protein SYN63AY4M2_13020 [Synechococcus sp. 63AY4M2]|jgi:hypothetical protein|nr:hypothetical protein SYN63AY4M2_13020 [Synechococcus sp. 63AY4M2]PIK93244.1 hypothetical protein SYN65AY6LI_10490 [Synechococcus sp. 65AY6Li]
MGRIPQEWLFGEMSLGSKLCFWMQQGERLFIVKMLYCEK